MTNNRNAGVISSVAVPRSVRCNSLYCCCHAAPSACVSTDAAAAAEPAAEADDWDGDGSPREEENTGQWSPAPLDPEAIPSGADVVHEDDDSRLLELMRAQVGTAGPKHWSCQSYSLSG